MEAMRFFVDFLWKKWRPFTHQRMILFRSHLPTNTSRAQNINRLHIKYVSIPRITHILSYNYPNSTFFSFNPMNHFASRLYEDEVDESTRLSQLLGVGIGLFQGLSNTVLNGKLLHEFD